MERKIRALLERKRIRINLNLKLIKIRIVEKRGYIERKG